MNGNALWLESSWNYLSIILDDGENNQTKDVEIVDWIDIVDRSRRCNGIELNGHYHQISQVLGTIHTVLQWNETIVHEIYCTYLSLMRIVIFLHENNWRKSMQKMPQQENNFCWVPSRPPRALRRHKCDRLFELWHTFWSMVRKRAWYLWRWETAR